MASPSKRRNVPEIPPQSIIPGNDPQTWLIQPVVVTLMHHNYSLTQTKILTAIIEKLQDAIKESLDQKKPTSQLTIFSDEQYSPFGDEDNLILPIKLNEFGVRPDHYNELRTALKLISTTPVETHITDKEGNGYIHFSGLCEAILPKENYSRQVWIKMKKQIAVQILDVGPGFHRFAKEVIFNSTNKYTPRFYLFCSSWKHKGGCIQKTKEIRKWLCLEGKYKDFKDFNKRVLLPAQEELKEKADCWFEVEKIYGPKQKKTDDPEKLSFKIISRNQLGISEKDSIAEMQKKGIISLLNEHFKLEHDQIMEISSKINSENYMDFTLYLSDLKMTCSKNKKIKNITLYAYKSIMNYFSIDHSVDNSILRD